MIGFLNYRWNPEELLLFSLRQLAHIQRQQTLSDKGAFPNSTQSSNESIQPDKYNCRTPHDSHYCICILPEIWSHLVFYDLSSATERFSWVLVSKIRRDLGIDIEAMTTEYLLRGNSPVRWEIGNTYISFHRRFNLGLYCSVLLVLGLEVLGLRLAGFTLWHRGAFGLKLVAIKFNLMLVHFNFNGGVSGALDPTRRVIFFGRVDRDKHDYCLFLSLRVWDGVLRCWCYSCFWKGGLSVVFSSNWMLHG